MLLLCLVICRQSLAFWYQFYKVVWQVATYARCGGIFNNQFSSNLTENQPVKEFWKLVGNVGTVLVPWAGDWQCQKCKYIFQIKYTEAIFSNSTRKLLWFETTKILMALLIINFIVLLIIIFGTLSFRISKVSPFYRTRCMFARICDVVCWNTLVTT